MRVELNIRRAKRYEVLHNNDLRMGLIYFVKSVIHPNTFCGYCITGDWTDKREFAEWFKQGRIYVLENAIDNNVVITDPY